jgi:hypothetical protein
MEPTKKHPVIAPVTSAEELTHQQLRWLRDKYNVQKKTQASRKPDRTGQPVKVTMTFDEWLAIWLESGKLHLRGKGPENYCMARNDDIGDYAVGNVAIKSIAQNSREGKLGRGGMKGRVSPTKGMKLSRTTCPHCGKSRTNAVLARWHGSRCKSNTNEDCVRGA